MVKAAPPRGELLKERAEILTDKDIDAMMALVRRALAINPNFARGWHIAGLLGVWAGEPDDALRYLEAALRLSPRARIGTSANLIGLAIFLPGALSKPCRR